MKRSKGEVPQKVRALLSLAEQHGWIARAVTSDVFKGVRDPWYSATNFVATRGFEVITMTWVDSVAVGPIGWYVIEGQTSTIKNRSSALRLLCTP